MDCLSNNCVVQVIGIALLLYLFYRYLTSSFDYFTRQGIPGPRPIPIFGTIWGVWKENLVNMDMYMAAKYGKIYGTFDGSKPNLFVSDPELIKHITVKDFEHFINKREFVTKTKVVRMFLTLLRNQAWKDVRSSISPTFSSGKIKQYSKLIKECTDVLLEKMEIQCQTTGQLDAKREFSALTMNVIATCAFGMKIQSLGQDDDPFIKNAAVVFNSPATKNPAVLIPFIFPWLDKIGIDFFNTKQIRFFIDVTTNLVNERHTTTQKFYDFLEEAIQAITDVSKSNELSGSGPVWNEEEIAEIVASQSLVFLLAGYDTTATTLTMISYFLAKHPEIQQKLYDDICKKMEHYEDISHEMVNDIPYAEQIINETLRLCPPILRTDRQCNKDIQWSDIRIEKGIIITIPIYALHHSEENFPDPELFDPERWSPGNKSTIKPYTFLPFGLGPRSCIGMRFALEELKITLCSMVRSFRFYCIPETPSKVVTEDGFQAVFSPKDIILGISKRE